MVFEFNGTDKITDSTTALGIHLVFVIPWKFLSFFSSVNVLSQYQKSIIDRIWNGKQTYKFNIVYMIMKNSFQSPFFSVL